jgi:D-alanyl-lipoteichoic acid acyltransferase DltB (MBOAT superfamily)
MGAAISDWASWQRGGTTLIANWTFVLWGGYRGVLLHLTGSNSARIERWRKELRAGLALLSVVAAGMSG